MSSFLSIRSSRRQEAHSQFRVPRSAFRTPRTPRRAFSLIEVLVVVGLMSLIILGLVMMFGQTQRAYRLGMTQVDVLEGGRAFTDMTTRELAQLTPSRGSNVVNFYMQIPWGTPYYRPLLQELPGNPSPGRTNVVEDLFFLTRENQRWTGIGYRLATPNEPMGTLYRYETNAPYGQDPYWLFWDFYRGPSLTNMTRILENVVHFKVRAFDTNGNWITDDLAKGANVRYSTLPFLDGEIGYYLMSNTVVPATVELELGILEERAASRAKSITDMGARSNYLAQQAGKVHVFRWRVPVRNVDPTAYQ